MNRIRLLVGDDANRRVLDEWLDDGDDVRVATTGAPGPEDDLCVVDEAGLEAHRAPLARWKAESDVFRPCLLVTERGEGALDGDDGGVVNDVVDLPTSQEGLHRRIDRLLSERAQSLQIDEERDSLREQNDRLRMFAGRLAHDLRNPLGIVTGYVQQARGAPSEEHFDIIQDGLDRIERLVDETLMLAKMGETAVDREPVALGAAARRAWSHVETGEATLSVAGDGTFDADESRVEELFENLFRNAVEHGAHGTAADDDGVTVTVGALEDGFYVADDGPGIDPSDREQVFEVGYTTHEDGTGFGLRIVREIADAHGWTVAVTDAEGGGARFEVRGADVGHDD